MRGLKIGLLLLALAGGWLLLATQAGPAAPPLAWAALSFGLAAAGYLGLGARVFGKRQDGTVPWWAALLNAPYLAFGWVSWQAVRLGPEETWNQIRPWLYLGRRPAPGELPEDSTLVIDLTAEFPRDDRVLAGRSYLCLPTLDAHVPSLQALRSLIEQASQGERVLYVHCAYGHGRSALVAAALLLRRGEAASADDALAQLKERRPRVKLSAPQQALLRRYAAESKGSLDLIC
jgi:protein-tyrosine phosphatase